MEKLLTLKQRNDEYVELVQLTDTHIFSSKEKKFDDINTLESLKKVISHIQGQQFSLDTILMTGDLVHEPV
ncbi:MAG: hypothetical protein GTO02_15380, partial [Candidatus Dadabacteria bacterium]|nr:hypothetical protein [Candidatus Dadabacteria bacterium]